LQTEQAAMQHRRIGSARFWSQLHVVGIVIASSEPGEESRQRILSAVDESQALQILRHQMPADMALHCLGDRCSVGFPMDLLQDFPIIGPENAQE
jgi:hypothetical protein